MSGGIRALLLGHMQCTGWNKAALAEALVVEPSVVNRWLHPDHPRRPSTEHCAKIAAVVELPTTKIMELAGHLPSATALSASSDQMDSEWDQFQMGLRALFAQVPHERWWPILEGLGSLVRALEPPGTGTKASIACCDKSVRRAYLSVERSHVLA